MSAYYNEIDAYAAAWLRNLIDAGHLPAGDIDTRSIVEVQPDDIKGYDECHFFAGIGGWPLALRMAGWTGGPVWTGSCPCQPFSSASRGLGMGTMDERHLWPEWFRLISARAPAYLFGEQVDEARSWLDEVWTDLERIGYAFGAAVLPAYAVEKDHARERIYFVGYSDSHSESSGPINAKASWVPGHRGNAGNLAREDGIPSRVGRLRAYGNAIVPALAAEFVSAFMECRP